MKKTRIIPMIMAIVMLIGLLPSMSIQAATPGDTMIIDGVAYVVGDENLITNGTFETDASGWKTYNGSKLAAINGTDIMHSTEQAHSGSGSLKVVKNGGGTSAGSLVGLFPLDDAVQAGDKYVLTLYFRGGTGLTLTAGLSTSTTSVTAVESCGGLGNSGTSPVSCNLTGLTANAWNKLSCVLTADSTTKAALIYARWCGGAYFDDVSLYKLSESVVSTPESVKAALDELDIAFGTKCQDIALPETATDSIGTTVDVEWASSDEDVIAFNGSVTAVEEVTTVNLTPSAKLNGATVTGDARKVIVFPESVAGKEYNSGEGIYTIGTENIISAQGTNASFEDQSYEGWMSHLGKEINNGQFWADSASEAVPDGNCAYIGKWNDNITHASNYCTFDTMWAVEAGTYYLSFYSKKPAGSSTTYVYFSTDNAHHTAEAQLTSEAWYEKVLPTSEWIKYEYIIEATEAGYIGFTSYNVGNNGSRGTYFDDFELYTAQQAAETLVSVPTVSATATVIAGNTPILPTVIKGTGSLGSNMEVAVEWDMTNADFTQAGEVTVPGTVTDTEFTTTAIITVLEETFSLNNAVSSNSTNNISFPLPIEDEFVLECDFVIDQVVDAGMHFGFDGSLWGSGAFGISPNGGILKATGGNGSGTSDGGAVLVPVVKNGETYRLLITVDASTDKFSVTATSADGTVTTVTDRRFRKDHDAINTINFRGNNVGANALGMKNTRVYAPGISKTDYTFVVTKDGATTTEVKGFWTQAEAEASVAEFENYHKEVTVSGTTITVVYTNTTVVKEEIANIAAIDDITVFVTDEVVLPENVKVTGTFDTEVDAAILWDAPEEFNAGTTEVTGAISAQFGEQEPIEETVTVKVTVIEEFTLPDTISFGAQPGNIVTFPVQIKNNFTMEFDYTINEVADASIQMGGDAGKLFGNGALGISPNGGALKARGEGNPVLIEEVNAGETYHMVLQMNASDDTYTLYVEKADGSVVTATEGFRKAQAYIDTMSVLLNGNNIDNTGTIVVSNITVNADEVELCEVTVNGEVAKVIKGRSYKAQTTGIARDDAGTIYVAVDGVAEVLVEGDMAITTQEIGLEMVNGAQVRVGVTELEEGEKLDAMADSGLRFLAMADYNDTFVADADEFGIKITAEGSDNVVYVKAEKFQNDDNSVFSAAITNLNESNYNRKYTAVAYAKLGDVEITTGSVTRSIYQVSAGIMKNGSADAENAPYTVDGVVKNILNAYVNQTGIRLSYTTDGIAVENGKYTGDVFFTVTSVSDGDDGFNVTITPDAEWGTPASIASWWTDYVRFNNNNSVAKGYISDAEIVDGTLTFNFDTTKD